MASSTSPYLHRGGFVNVLPRNGRVLLWVARGKGVDGRQHGAHGVRAVGQGHHDLLHIHRQGRVAHDGILPLAQLVGRREVAKDQQVGNLRAIHVAA